MSDYKYKIYISGPITGVPDYKDRFQKVEDMYKAQGIYVINPAKLNDVVPEEGTTWEQYIHNHPRGAPPSVADINELVGSPNSIGITVGHDGRVFRYSAPSEKITKRDIAVAARKITWYDGIDEDFELIKQLSKSFKFDFTEL